MNQPQQKLFFQNHFFQTTTITTKTNTLRVAFATPAVATQNFMVPIKQNVWFASNQTP
jgi:hypothetical protein